MENRRRGRSLAVARMVGHITYMSDASMRDKFGRRLQDKDAFGFDFSMDFEVESYLRYRGSQFVDRFDANSYLYITKAMDLFDLAQGKPSLAAAFDNTQARFLVISFTSDWLYPTYQSLEIVSALRGAEHECGVLRTARQLRPRLLSSGKQRAGGDGQRFPGKRGRGLGPAMTKAEKPAIHASLTERKDYLMIAEIVTQGARVLDLGCGEGGLLLLVAREPARWMRGASRSVA